MGQKEQCFVERNRLILNNCTSLLMILNCLLLLWLNLLDPPLNLVISQNNICLIGRLVVILSLLWLRNARPNHFEPLLKFILDNASSGSILLLDSYMFIQQVLIDNALKLCPWLWNFTGDGVRGNWIFMSVYSL